MNKKKVFKAKSGQDKVAQVMREFKEGKLKSSSGKLVTDRNQAIAIAMHEAGLSNKSLEKAEIKNKLRLYKAELERMIQKDMTNDKAIKAEIIKLFKKPGPLDDREVHSLAERLQISPHDLEDHIYSILRDIVTGGKSEGKILAVDPAELAQGIKIESEHTAEPALQEKIARDHLAEDPKYYTKLQRMESGSEKVKKNEEDETELNTTKIVISTPEPIRPVIPAIDYEAEIMASELPGEIPKGLEDLFKKIYASCRKGGGGKLQSAQLAWSEIQNSIKQPIAI
jgi:hypothetical protein